MGCRIQLRLDSLGRVTSAKTPESNQAVTTFTYDDPDSGQVKTRTDARGVVTTYTYDGLNRLGTVSYSDGTPGVTYTYGASSAANNNGRLISAADSSGAPAWSTIYGYNNLGQVTGVTKTISGAIYNIGYAYNAAGELASITYPSGRVVNQSYDPIGRLQTIADSTNNYLTITPTTDYNAAGQLKHFAYGNGVAADFGYNDHLQLASIRYSKTGQPDLLNLAYSYGAANNGQIASIADNTTSGDHSRDMTYTYDAWSRLSTAQAGPTGAETWKYSYNYDRFGNRRNQNVIAGTGTQVLLTIDQNTNRITDAGNSYDAAGNMTADSMHAYTYDAENRMKTVDVTAATYSYDDGVRIKKVVGTTTTVYVFSGTKVIAEYANGSLSKEYIYSGSKLLATVVDRAVTYSHADHLSGRVESSSTGTVTRTYGNLPFGETSYETGTAGKLKFTSYERDSESGLDYAMARQDSSRLGRFMSPDPLAGSLADPQSLNRYAYTRNDPINLVDPTGMDFNITCEVGKDCGQPGGGGGGGGGIDWKDFGFSRGIGDDPIVSGRDGDLWGDTGYGRNRSGFGIDACGVDIYCSNNGGIGPFGSPVAQIHCDRDGCMTGSWAFSQYHVGGTYTVDWQAQRQAEINAALRKINGAFSLIATNLGLDPNKQVQASVQYKAGVWNVSLWNCTTDCTVNSDNANESGWPDPITYMHQGNSSWYFGSLFGFDAGHLIRSDPASAHIDPFGPFNPLHYLIQLPAMLFPGGPVGYTTCSINGGCN